MSPTTADDVRAELGDAVDFVPDGGPCEVGVESTIVDATGEIPTILRPGGVTREDLEAVLGCPLAVPSTSHIRVPGQHPSHYAPRVLGSSWSSRRRSSPRRSWRRNWGTGA